MQSIIIPVDFSKNSKLILEYTVNLFSSEDVRYILLHAYSTRPTSALLISIDDIIERDINQKLEEKANYLQSVSNSNKLNIIKVCERNDLISAISDAKAKYEADLLVLGTNGEESWSDIVYPKEGKTMNIISSIDLPTLIIPNVNKINLPKNILFATVLDGIHKSDEVKPLIELIKKCKAHLDILNVGLIKNTIEELDNKLSQTINGYFKEVTYDLHTILDKDAQVAIGEFSQKHHNDLVCIMYRKHSLLENLLNKSVSKGIIKHAEWPILALKQAI